MLNKKKERRLFKPAVAIMLIVMIVILISPPPYYLILPGETNSTVGLFKSVGDGEAENPSNDQTQLFYTTVLLSETDWLTIVKTSFDTDYALSNKNQLLQGKTLKEYKAKSKLVMKQSFYESLEAAYDYLNIEFQKEAVAVYVTQSQNKNKYSFLEADQISAIELNGQRTEIRSMNQLVNHVNALAEQHIYSYNLVIHTMDEERVIEINHQSLTAPPLQTEELAQLYGVSSFVELSRVNAIEEHYQFTMQPQQIGGPSAGLILTLTFIQAMQEHALQTPYRVAGTGSIEAGGRVGVIGSIEQKVVTVDEAQIDLFLVPKEQLKQAKEKAESMDSAVEIIGVETIDEAISVINSYHRAP